MGDRNEEKLAAEPEPEVDAEAQKAKLEEDIEFMLFRETPQQWANAARAMASAAMNQSLKAKAVKGMIERAAGRGRQFTRGSSADSVLENANGYVFSRAIQTWRSQNLRVKRRSLSHVMDFLSRVTPEHWKNLKMAYGTCRRIVLQSRDLPAPTEEEKGDPCEGAEYDEFGEELFPEEGKKEGLNVSL